MHFIKNQRIPLYLLGISVGLIVTFSAFSDITDHQTQQTPLTYFGVQGGNQNDYDRKGCWIGTLGCLVKDSDGKIYILSNNHVLARSNLATSGELGESIMHTVSTKCDSRAYIAGILSKFVPINFGNRSSNTVDAAIALVNNAKVDPSGWIMGESVSDKFLVIDSPVDPNVGMSVKKSGRTTGLTTSKISAIDVTVSVDYGKGKTAKFYHQILIPSQSRTKPFSAGGDSGSLIVTDDYRPVGLLFAGSTTTTIANPIKEVESLLEVTFVGIAAKDQPSGVISAEMEDPVIEYMKQVREKHKDKISGIPEIIGSGIGVGKGDEEPAIELYVETLNPALLKALPRVLDDVPVRVIETGKIIAF